MHMACLSYHLSTIPYLSYVPEFHCLIMRQRIFRIHYFRWDVRHRQDRSSQSLSVLAYSPLFTNSREPNIEMISKACDIYNIPIATNIATAESLVIGLQKGDLEWRENI